MDEKKVLNPEKIKGLLFERRVLRETPGLTAEIVPLDLADISGTPESIHSLIDFIISLEDPKFDAKKCKMPLPLAKAVIKMLAKEMDISSGRIPFATIIEALSFQLDMSYKEVYELMGMDAEDVINLRNLIIVDTSDKDIDNSLSSLKKFAAALKMNDIEMERSIYASFAGLYPSPISLKNADDPGYEGDHVRPEAVAITQRIVIKLFPLS